LGVNQAPGMDQGLERVLVVEEYRENHKELPSYDE
jgi:hypothetical protein